MLTIIGSGWTLAGRFICKKKKAPKLKFDLLIKTDIYIFLLSDCQLPVTINIYKTTHLYGKA